MTRRWDHEEAYLSAAWEEGPVVREGVEDLIDVLPLWRKTALTAAVLMHGPFTVMTREGPLTCPDGYLAVDSEGWPYPIALDEFRRIYEPADDDA